LQQPQQVQEQIHNVLQNNKSTNKKCEHHDRVTFAPQSFFISLQAALQYPLQTCGPVLS
jgi:hypothetical protein